MILPDDFGLHGEASDGFKGADVGKRNAKIAKRGKAKQKASCLTEEELRRNESSA